MAASKRVPKEEPKPAKAANEDILNEVHGLVWLQLVNRLRAGGILTAAELSVVAKMLRDNDIECDGSANPNIRVVADRVFPDFNKDDDEGEAPDG